MQRRDLFDEVGSMIKKPLPKIKLGSGGADDHAKE
jgi:hypothetical protein